jgi:catechol 2,3-dioxygenase-like lactoylglutathione lyase family enzyme
MSAIATAAAVRFQVSLHVTNLDRSVQFYKALLAIEPTLHGSQQVRFELANPPVALTLVPAAQVPLGTLNHVGLRLPDSATLVDLQRRLEETGISTQRQEGVECCYARQTKFWVTDPDRHLWEIYVLEEDIDHSGFEDAPRVVKPAAAPSIWNHLLTQEVPARIPHDDASLDEVRLEGTFNGRFGAVGPAAFLAEIFRVLRPGGKVAIHGLAAEQPMESPGLPGLAALVQRVPGMAELSEALGAAGFGSLYFEKLAITCLGGAFREVSLIGWRPVGSSDQRRVLYKGPLAALTDEDGITFRRGEAVVVSETAWQRLQQGPAAGQFLVFPARPTG